MQQPGPMFSRTSSSAAGPRATMPRVAERPARPSDAPKRDALDAMVGALAQDQASALPGGQDVVVEVLLVDRAPDLQRLGARLVGGELGVAMEVGGGIAKRRLAQAHEAGDVPLLDDLGVGVHV